MAAPRKPASERQSVTVALGLTPAEADVFNAYCLAIGQSRSAVVRQLIRRLKLGDLNPQARSFRELQAALPPLEGT